MRVMRYRLESFNQVGTQHGDSLQKLKSRQYSSKRNRGVTVLPPDKAFWFAVQTVPQHEHRVSAQLRNRGHEEFLPTVQMRRQWSDRTRVSERPLFPGYVFCRVQRSSFGGVLNTPGVYRIVSFGGHPYPISDEEVLFLRRVVHSGRDIRSVPYFSLGKKVRVADGPLSGLDGIIVKIKNRNRLVISIDLLMRSVAVDIALSELATRECSEFHISD
jgi:transcription antitermination factor NusG